MIYILKLHSFKNYIARFFFYSLVKCLAPRTYSEPNDIALLKLLIFAAVLCIYWNSLYILSIFFCDFGILCFFTSSLSCIQYDQIWQFCYCGGGIPEAHLGLYSNERRHTKMFYCIQYFISYLISFVYILLYF